MKCILTLFFLISVNAFSQSSFYQLSLSTSPDSISLQQFTGQRILIACVTPDSLGEDGVQYFDSLQHVYSDLQVIVMPIMDLGGDSNIAVFNHLHDLPASFIWAMPAFAQDTDSTVQDPVIRWLTRIETNTHFNVNINRSQVFVVSALGDLYAVLNDGFRNQVLSDILQQQP